MDTATLVFEEYPDDEIVVRLSPVPMRDYFGLAQQLDAASSAADYTALFGAFVDAGVLVSWTFPEPCDLPGMMARDFKLNLAIIRQWIAGVRSVPLPLPRRPSGGTPSTPEASPPSSTEPSS
ncbi:hypothetical protein UFOVP1028_38 [uncultured Caudovirales phage]|uniref:Uncharacterized protein n=1 Tax=uncultured Caudovirales phage TaxID=2100421 RepID=A0A6J5Q3G1_9CAUD|nr:hypothetical protein UFOVP960_3 [uncultured Caudovirales phage]CAB4179120.1 hypothetical protein UFOVP1028_38 [uncultured Caudovirales phage]CAB4189444.1 hypothetical protein UFOVP1187_27 [uncultured Caudovirales phage]CAB4192526.1 hypothetical protein UFOVP1235_44 [uncultured Caudovirales phage]CAB4215870.1 hypothetical protein UFOVP1488_27 [uncultured Caudovirales phage]